MNNYKLEDKLINILDELYGYLEVGKTYFFRVAFTIIEEMGSFNVNIESFDNIFIC